MCVEMLAEPGIVIEPPKRDLRDHQVPGAAGTQAIERVNRGGAIGGVVAGVQTLLVAEKVPSRPSVESEQTFVTFAHDQGYSSKGERRFYHRPQSRNQLVVLEAGEVSTNRLQRRAIARQALMSGRERRLQTAVAGRDLLQI